VADVQERMFRYFWETTNPVNGLAPDRFPSQAPSSIAAIGFALTAYPIGVERGFISRAMARHRVLTTLQFLLDAPQGPAERGVSGYKGFYYHFLDMTSGERAGKCELSTIDTALLLAGILFCQSYFDLPHQDEDRIRSLAVSIYARVDWRWAQPRSPAIVLGWTPEKRFLPWDWRVYCEAMIMYLLALGSPTYRVERAAWSEWTKSFEGSWGNYYGEKHIPFASLFAHLFSQVWVDCRGIQDAFTRNHNLDYFENARRAVYAQRNYAIANPMGWTGYGANVWGISACDGPAEIEVKCNGQTRCFRRYAARGAVGPSAFDDGTLTPSVVLGALAVAPEVALPTIAELYRRYGEHIYARYGFIDAFNPSFDFDVPVSLGRVIPGFGWVDSDYVGIDQGLALAMVENFRSELIWRTMRKNRFLKAGLLRAGFAGSWLDENN
jgi:hypothetical protein